MGGSGEYYDRDVSDRRTRTSKGTTDFSERLMSRTSMNAALSVLRRNLVCKTESPLTLDFDVTGSLGDEPKIFCDKVPLVVEQIAKCHLLDEPQMSLGAIGDVVCDEAPLQVADYTNMRNLDEWLKRIWLEGNGGGQGYESYEFMAYFRTRYCQLPNAKMPIQLITGDERFREELPGHELAKWFGGEHETVKAVDVFADLRRQNHDNVAHVHRAYAGGSNKEIIAQWARVVGDDFVVRLQSDLAIGDVIIGIYALFSRRLTLEKYLETMVTMRIESQTSDRIAEVKDTLEQLSRALTLKGRGAHRNKAKAEEPADSADPQKKLGKKVWL